MQRKGGQRTSQVASDSPQGSSENAGARPSKPEEVATRTASPSAIASDCASLAAHEQPRSGSTLRDPDRYQIIAEHGRGGLGRVYRARDRDLDRDVAIKELISRTDVSEMRFLREALITARLEHPGIVPVHEAGRWPDGTPFYAMKLVAGRPLRDLILERSTVERRLRLLHHVIAVADAIAYAHGQNIIHRDLKPANVIVGDFGETIVIDWGLAKDLTLDEEGNAASSSSGARVSDQITVAGSILGTPAYMAPEQERGERVDQRADVFAIGAMLWELCSLQKVPPTERQLRHRLLQRAGIERDLITIIDKALERDPTCRYADAGELATDLKSFKAGAPISARRYSAPERLVRWARNHRALTVSLAAVIAIAIVALPLYVHNISAEQDRTARALASATQQREHAVIAQAALLLDKDPTRVPELLATISSHTAQYALLASRAKQHSASLVVDVPGGIRGILAAPDGRHVALRDSNNELYDIDVGSGERRFVNRDIDDPFVWDRGALVYLHHPQTTPFAALMGRPTGAQQVRATPSPSIALAAAVGAIYSLHKDGSLLELRGQRETLIKQHVAEIAGDEEIALFCSTDGTLDVIGAHPADDLRCMADQRSISLYVSGANFIARSAASRLLLWRAGKLAELAMPFADLFELSISSTGVAAGIGYRTTNDAWFVRPTSTTREYAPPYTAAPVTVATGGTLVAWGYSDGLVVVLDIATDQTWRLVGHPAAASFISVDSSRSRLITTSENELRVWSLRQDAVHRLRSLPCTSFNIQLSADSHTAALDCDDGSVWAWTPTSSHVARIHKHDTFAYGVQWRGGSVCSAGWEGKLICSKGDGADREVFDTHRERIVSLEADPTHDQLVLATTDGAVWAFDGKLRELYQHSASPYRVAISSKNVLASCDIAGGIVVYDMIHNQLLARITGHVGAIHGIGWHDDELWTSGVDGTLRSWILREKQMNQARAIYEGQRFRLTKRTSNGWIANIGDSVIVFEPDSGADSFRFDLGKRVMDIDISSDKRFASFSTQYEITVLDLLRRRLASLTTDREISGFVKLIDHETLAVNVSGFLAIADIRALNYVAFDSDQQSHTGFR